MKAIFKKLMLVSSVALVFMGCSDNMGDTAGKNIRKVGVATCKLLHRQVSILNGKQLVWKKPARLFIRLLLIKRTVTFQNLFMWYLLITTGTIILQPLLINC